MSPFYTLFKKEYREHRISLLTVFCILCTIPAIPVLYFEARLGFAFLVSLFYMTATAAMSYAKEDEAKTALFLRMLPMSGQTLLYAKLTWLATVILILHLPLVLYIRYASLFFEPSVPVSVSYAFAATFLALSWAFFWTTRYPSKLFATLLACLCAICTGGFIHVAILFMAIVTGSINDIRDWYHSLLTGSMITVISLPIGWLGLRRAARYYRQPELEPKRNGRQQRSQSVSAKPRFLTRLFPQKTWSPLTAMLWQSTGQSRDILLLGLFTALVFCLWNSFYLLLSPIDDHSYFGRAFQALTVILNVICVPIGFGFAATIFSQDQESQKYRILTGMGISRHLIWWSRILPFAAVYLIPLLFAGIFAMCGMTLYPGEWGDPKLPWMVSAAIVLYLLPFSLGSFFSMFCRSILMSIIWTFGLWSVSFCMVISELAREPSHYSIIIAAVSIIAFPAASHLLVGDWLKEKPRWFSAAKLLAIFGTGSVLFCLLIAR
jgi:hypothetical protein